MISIISISADCCTGDKGIRATSKKFQNAGCIRFLVVLILIHTTFISVVAWPNGPKLNHGATKRKK
jgi:hypothetical protein